MREATHQYPIQEIHMADLTDIAPANVPAARLIRNVAISLVNNIISSICKPIVGGHFELKQNTVQLLHTSG